MMKKIKIVYEDRNIIVVNKESGLLTIGTNKERDRTLYNEVKEYVKKQYPKNKIFIVHRLDKDTSGLVLFAKSELEKKKWQSIWNEVSRKYYAIVEGKLKNKQGKIELKLYETKSLDVVVNNKLGKRCITNYRVIDSNNSYSLLEIDIKTGRRNQIRASVDYIGHPIIGDKKYNSKKNPLKRLGLHAYLLEYKNKKFEIDMPKEFNRLLHK
jgi:RluA family pseudouridine synthase